MGRRSDEESANDARRGGTLRSLWRAELARGLALDNAGDSDGARAAFARAHALAPDEAQPAFRLARAEQRRGRLLEAERLHRLALAVRPDWPLPAIALARLIVDRAQPSLAAALAEARRILARPRATHPEHHLLQLIEAQLLCTEERLDDARALMESLRHDGFVAPAWSLQMARLENASGIALSRAGHDDAALFAFKRACDFDPRWAPPRANLGALWQRLGKLQKAVEQYRRALQIDPTHGLACFNLGLVLRERGDLDAAARALAAAVTGDPPHPDARVELARTLCERGEPLRAVLLLEEELRHRTTDLPHVYAYLGIACMQAGEPSRAEAALRQALALDGNQALALRNLAAIYAQQGRVIEAAALLRRLRELGNSGASPASK